MDLTRQFALPRGITGKLVGRLMAKRHVWQVDAVIADLKPTTGESVLEIGFGPGTSLVALAQAQSEVRISGIDPSPLMVAEARRRVRRFGPQIQVLEGTAATLPWDEAHFDAVFAINSVQLWQPRVGSLIEVLRVLKPGGRLVLGVVEVAVLPDLSRVGPEFDKVLVPQLTEAGFAEVGAEWRPKPGGGQCLFVHAVRPVG
jgi:ubiquinone/menaquinone biosynthesis C-methylase UbiE